MAKGSRKNNSAVPRASLGHADKACFAGNGCSLAEKRNAGGGVQGRPNTGTYFCASPDATGDGRISLELDPRVALEALVLNRLERIPAARRQEWLRGLLVQGFRQECQTLRVVQDEPHPQSLGPQQGQGRASHQPGSPFAAWLVKSMPPSGTPIQPIAVAVETSGKGHPTKPFAGLRKVIG